MNRKKINVILNNKIVEAYENETVLEVAKRNGIEIPTLCYDPRLEPYSSCYICVVEIENMRGLQPSCSTLVTEGMKIITDNERIYKARKAALELLLSNHYADCVAPCKLTCPANVDVQGYISLIEKKLYDEAVKLIKESNPLPAICGRVCVRGCEYECRRNLVEGVPVGIDYLKRFVADYDLFKQQPYRPNVKSPSGKKVAIIGSGPAGLTAAYYLQQEGHYCDIFEAQPKAGGWLRYGIPEYRLPNDIVDKEIQLILNLGLSQIHYNKKLGETLHYSDLKDKYDAIIIAIGSQASSSLDCEGEDAINVFGGVDFLRNMELTGKKYDLRGKVVAVIGGGNTAMDCCRTAVRCGADKVYVIYRRTEKEMPANPIEIHESKLEGVEYMFLTAPKKIIKDSEGKVKSLVCIKMTLGEPDSSGRRRPIPLEGSDFELKVDYVIAAIGQKTIASFINEINNDSKNGKINLNKWGDIEVNPDTLQTGIPNIFACGDAVKGPATVIEAIAQGKLAAQSCHNYLTNQKIDNKKYEFISRKDNFKKQEPSEYKNKFVQIPRNEMPTLPPSERKNFNEVELGYTEEMALNETTRCLECGCVAYYDCDLRKYASIYKADQKTYSGSYKEYEINFQHPFIEIDNNKCILCARCIRICSEVVGAYALGLVNRGFETYVAPSANKSLLETHCESCGLCISTCPTAAISENTKFKIAPLKTNLIHSVCNYCSVGCELNYKVLNNFVFGVEGHNGKINSDSNICGKAKFGYTYINDKNRLLTPLLKKENTWSNISFNEAYKILVDTLKDANKDEIAIFVGARLSNEELFLLYTLAYKVLNTKNFASFNYLGKESYIKLDNTKNSIPFDVIKKSNKVYIIETEINYEHPVINYMIFNHKHRNQIPIAQITTKPKNKLYHKVDETLKVDSIYYFIKALNYFVLHKELYNKNINENYFSSYKNLLLNEDYESLLKKAGINNEIIERIVQEAINSNVVFVTSEYNLSHNTLVELLNLKSLSNYFTNTIILKEKNNSAGFFKFYNDNKLNCNLLNDLIDGKIKYFLIFGEDPLGTAVNKELVKQWFFSAKFIFVQDYFMTETAKIANLVLPYSLSYETGGSFTNSNNIILKFDKFLNPPFAYDNIQQYIEILKSFNSNSFENLNEILNLYINDIYNFKAQNTDVFLYTKNEETLKLFINSCDCIENWRHSYFEDNLLKIHN